jgi:hypothetical protein
MKWIVLLVLAIGFWMGVNGDRALAGNLADRVENYPLWLSKPSVKTAEDDLIYPDWMAGTWTVTSVLVDLAAPLAPDIVTPGFEGSRRSLGESIQFPVRFIERSPILPKRSSLSFPIIGKVASVSGKAPIVADRAFNSVAIGRAYLGNRELLAVKVDPENPNRQIGFFRGDRQWIATIVGRGWELPEGDRFIATELSQQIFRGAGDLYLNEVETTTDYRLQADGRITADQFSAVYLSPRDPDYFRALDRPVALYRYRLDLEKTTDSTR